MTSLSDRVAEEVRVLLARRRMSQRQLAQQLQVSPAWLNYRLTGVQAIDLNDLQMIADALGVEPHDFLPRGDVSHTLRYPSILAKSRTDTQRPPSRKPGKIGPESRRPHPIPRPIAVAA